MDQYVDRILLDMLRDNRHHFIQLFRAVNEDTGKVFWFTSYRGTRAQINPTPDGLKLYGRIEGIEYPEYIEDRIEFEAENINDFMETYCKIIDQYMHIYYILEYRE